MLGVEALTLERLRRGGPARRRVGKREQKSNWHAAQLEPDKQIELRLEQGKHNQRLRLHGCLTLGIGLFILRKPPSLLHVFARLE